MINKKIGILILVFSLVFLFIGFSFETTGNFIKEYFQDNFLLFHLIGIILFFVFLLILIERKTLDAIIIPTSASKECDIERTKKAIGYSNKEGAKYFLISGQKGNVPLTESARATIYLELRKYDIKPSSIRIEGKSADSLENVIYSLEKLKNIKKIGIVSYPKHLQRFKYIINKAKKENMIPNDIEVQYIPTKESFKEKAYGNLALVKEKYRLRKGIKNAQEHKTNWLGNLIKKVIS